VTRCGRGTHPRHPEHDPTGAHGGDGRDAVGRARRDRYNSHMEVEVLTFEGCPNAEAALALVHELIRELGVDAVVREIRVESPEAAERHRFLG
jgi:hypothetical protein